MGASAVMWRGGGCGGCGEVAVARRRNGAGDISSATWRNEGHGKDNGKSPPDPRNLQGSGQGGCPCHLSNSHDEDEDEIVHLIVPGGNCWRAASIAAPS